MVTKDTASLVGTLVDVCIVLTDASEVVASSTGDPTSRANTFAFATGVSRRRITNHHHNNNEYN